jgi:hypothetical protein
VILPEYVAARIRTVSGTTYSMIEQFTQIAKGPVWDGNLIAKSYRDELKRCGYVDQINGWNILTPNGAIVAINLRILKP